MATEPTPATIEQRILRMHRDLLDALERISIMATDLTAANTKADALIAAATEAKADADRQAALVAQAVTAMGDMRAALADLQAQVANGQGPTAAEVGALVAKMDSALATLADANTARDAADAALQGGIPPAA